MFFRLLLPLVILVVISCAGPSSTPVFGRVWTDTQGATLEADFVRVFRGYAILSVKGAALRVPVGSLSEADRQYIEARTTNKRIRPSEPEPVETAKTGSPSFGKRSEGERHETREWTDRNGNKVTASFEKVFGDNVVLLSGDEQIVVAFDQISDDDKEYVRGQIRTWLEGLGKQTPTEPAAPAVANASPTQPGPQPVAPVPSTDFPQFDPSGQRTTPSNNPDQVAAFTPNAGSQFGALPPEFSAPQAPGDVATSPATGGQNDTVNEPTPTPDPATTDAPAPPKKTGSWLKDLGVLPTEGRFSRLGMNWPTIVLAIGALALLGGGFFLVMAGFQENVMWGLGCLFFPPTSILFMILNPQLAGPPFLVAMVGGLLTAVGLVAL